MPAYLYQASYSGEAIKALVNNPQDRSGAARAAIEANGGTMIGAWMAVGMTSSPLQIYPMMRRWPALRWRLHQPVP